MVRFGRKKEYQSKRRRARLPIGGGGGGGGGGGANDPVLLLSSDRRPIESSSINLWGNPEAKNGQTQDNLVRRAIP